MSNDSEPIEEDDREKEVKDCDGVIANSISAVSDEDSYLISLTIEDFEEVNLDKELNRRVDKLGIQFFATLFEHVFKDDPFEDIDEDSFNLYLAIDKDVFHKEVRVTIEDLGRPVKIKLHEDDIDPNDETRFVPDVNISEEVKADLEPLEDQNSS